MSGTPLLSPADIATATQLRSDGFATRMALADPPFDLALKRWDVGAGSYLDRPVQRVLVSYSNRQPTGQSGETAQAQFADGVFEKELPFDVQVGDKFKLPSGQAGFVTLVPMAQHGTQVAQWSTDEGQP